VVENHISHTKTGEIFLSDEMRRNIYKNKQLIASWSRSQ